MMLIANAKMGDTLHDRDGNQWVRLADGAIRCDEGGNLRFREHELRAVEAAFGPFVMAPRVNPWSGRVAAW